MAGADARGRRGRSGRAARRAGVRGRRGPAGGRVAASVVRAWISACALAASVLASLTPLPSAAPHFGSVFGPRDHDHGHEDDDEDEQDVVGMRRMVQPAAVSAAVGRPGSPAGGRCGSAENEATLLSTSRPPSPPSMTSTSRSVAALPLRETTQIAPFGADPRRQVVERRERGDRVGAEQDDVGLGLGPALGQVGRPVGDERPDRRGRRCR